MPDEVNVEPGTSTTEPEETPPSAGEGAEETSESTPTEAVAFVNDEFEFSVPENMEVDTEAVKGLKSFASENKMPQEMAQKTLDYLLDRQNKASETHKEAIEKEIQEIKKDPDVGGSNYEKAQKAVDKVALNYGGADFQKAINDAGFKNDLGFVRFMNNLSKVLSEQPVKNTSQTKGVSDRPKTPEEEADEFFKKD